MPRAASLSDQIRRAITYSGMSRGRICRATGLDPAAMSRVMAGRAWMHVRSMDAIAELLGLEIVADPKSEAPEFTRTTENNPGFPSFSAGRNRRDRRTTKR